MLHRLIYVSEIATDGGFTVSTLAEIMGAALSNNRRDQITSGLLTHKGRVIQVIEGARPDIDRLMRRLRADPRHRDLRVLVDRPVAARRMRQPLCLRREAADLLAQAGLSGLERVEANDAERLLDTRLAA